VTLDLTGRTPTPEAVTRVSRKHLAHPARPAGRQPDRALSRSSSTSGRCSTVTSSATLAFSSNIQIFIGGREAYHQFIYNSIANNRPYDQIATEMIARKWRQS
jgi:hypothetical protein